MDQAAARLLGLNRTDTQCLEWLGRVRSASAGTLADHIGLTAGAATTVIDRLERAGFARRGHDSGDRRKVIVEVTERGDVTCPRIYQRLVQGSRRLLTQYEPSDLAVIASFLARVRAVIAAHTRDLRAGVVELEADAALSTSAGGGATRRGVPPD